MLGYQSVIDDLIVPDAHHLLLYRLLSIIPSVHQGNRMAGKNDWNGLNAGRETRLKAKWATGVIPGGGIVS